MKLRTPNYYESFKCIASKCKDSCCSAGWEIDIDDKTVEFYKNVTGEFGEKIKKKIEFNPPAHFKINKDCPFLNENKLCDIYINLGEENLCQICKDHPRYYEWFENVKEAGIGLCCEEAARIILSQKDNFSLIEKEFTPTKTDIENSEYKYDNEIYDYLLHSREKIINYIDYSSLPLDVSLRNILWYSYILQQNLDNFLLDDDEIIDISNDRKNDSNTANSKNIDETNTATIISEMFEFYKALEPNDEKWPEYLEQCAKTFQSTKHQLQDFENANPNVELYLKNIAIYFIWRYFLKGVFDEEIFSKIKLMYISIFIIKIMFFCEWIKKGSLTLEDCIDIVKKYSEEIEYCEENLDALADASYDLEIFSIETLLNI